MPVYNSAGKDVSAGRPKAKHTLAAEKAKAILIAKVEAEMGPIADELIKKAKTGDVPAIKEVFDRTWGKSPQGLELSGDVTTRIISIDE